jgi:predicted  nucleic acid-binding Zn-ribbon protein
MKIAKFLISELRSDIETALEEYHRVRKEIDDAKGELARLGAAVTELDGRGKVHEKYLLSLGKFHA